MFCIFFHRFYSETFNLKNPRLAVEMTRTVISSIPSPEGAALTSSIGAENHVLRSVLI
jgi:hypothetical protein